jgi:hypothetical protein
MILALRNSVLTLLRGISRRYTSPGSVVVAVLHLVEAAIDDDFVFGRAFFVAADGAVCEGVDVAADGFSSALDHVDKGDDGCEVLSLLTWNIPTPFLSASAAPSPECSAPVLVMLMRVDLGKQVEKFGENCSKNSTR